MTHTTHVSSFRSIVVINTEVNMVVRTTVLCGMGSSKFSLNDPSEASCWVGDTGNIWLRPEAPTHMALTGSNEHSSSSSPTLAGYPSLLCSILPSPLPIREGNLHSSVPFSLVPTNQRGQPSFLCSFLPGPLPIIPLSSCFGHQPHSPISI